MHGPKPSLPTVLSQRTDEELARRAGRGDDEAFATLFGRYQPRLERYCGGILRHREDARDATQSALTKALVALRQHERDVQVRPWLFRIAHNEAVSSLRRRRDQHELSDALPSTDHGPAEALALREELARTVATVRALPQQPRDALVLREVGDLEYAEVAEALGISAQSARQAVSRGRAALAADRIAEELDCGSIRTALAAGDGRRRRAHAVRGHLRSCEACRTWEHARRGSRRAAVLPVVGPAWSWLSDLVCGGPATTAGAGMGAAGGAKLAAALTVVAAGVTPVVGPELRPHHPTAVARTVRHPAASAAKAPAPDTRAAAAPVAAAAPLRTTDAVARHPAVVRAAAITAPARPAAAEGSAPADREGSEDGAAARAGERRGTRGDIAASKDGAAPGRGGTAPVAWVGGPPAGRRSADHHDAGGRDGSRPDGRAPAFRSGGDGRDDADGPTPAEPAASASEAAPAADASPAAAPAPEPAAASPATTPAAG